jgi:hypothetical protein
MFRSIIEFFKAVGKWWWAVTIDLFVGALLGTAQSAGYALRVPHWLWQAMILAGFVIACLVAFHRLRIQRDEAISKCLGSIPNFKGVIEEINTADGPIPDGTMVPRIIIKMTIVNRGVPSIAQSFHIFLQLPDGQKIRGEPSWGGNGDLKLFSEGGKSVQILPATLYMPVVGMTPIPQGGKSFGYLAAAFPGMNMHEIRRHENILIATFDDVNDKTFSCSLPILGTDTIEGQSTYPSEMINKDHRNY